MVPLLLAPQDVLHCIHVPRIDVHERVCSEVEVLLNAVPPLGKRGV